MVIQISRCKYGYIYIYKEQQAGSAGISKNLDIGKIRDLKVMAFRCFLQVNHVTHTYANVYLRFSKYSK